MGRKGRGLWDIESFFVARRGNEIVQNGLVLFLKDHSYFHSAKVKAIWRTSVWQYSCILAVTNILVLERRVFYWKCNVTCCNVLAGTLVLGKKCLSFMYHDLKSDNLQYTEGSCLMRLFVLEKICISQNLHSPNWEKTAKKSH